MSENEFTYVHIRVARFFWVHGTKTGKSVPNEYKMYQMVIKYPKCQSNIPKSHKKENKTFSNLRPSKINPSW
jgi:hypothetical protein